MATVLHQLPYSENPCTLTAANSIALFSAAVFFNPALKNCVPLVTDVFGTFELLEAITVAVDFTADIDVRL